MNDHIDNDVRRHYASQSLPDDSVQAILDASDLAATAVFWRNTALASMVACAVTLLIAIRLWTVPPEHRAGEDSSAAVIPAERPGTDDAKDAIPQPVPGPLKNEADTNRNIDRYRLVAFRSHSDACPHCRATGIAYRQLADHLKEEAIDLRQFDLSKPEVMADVDPELRPLIEGRSETAFLALLDFDGRLIREFKPSQTSARIARDVRKLISR